MEGFLQILPELGSTALMGVVFVYIFTKMHDGHRKDRHEYNENYRTFVRENNHQKTEMIQKQIESLHVVKDELRRLSDKKCDK